MRIVYFGDGPWAHQALDRILADDAVDVGLIVPRYDTQDPELRRRAEEHGIDFLPIRNVNEPEGLKRLAAYEADLLVSMSFDQIFRTGILELCPQGAINCHAGALPFYRGRNILNWALINDEREFGVTVHYMDEGIDTGDIILQRVSPITDDDDYATLLERAVGLCAQTLHEAVGLLAAGRAPSIDQTTIHPIGFYTGRRIEGDEWIDWSWPSRRIFNFVRALTTPGPCARTWVAGTELLVVRAAMIPAAPAYISTPGEVVGRDGDAVQVKTGDSTISLLETRSDAVIRLRIGTRMLSPVDRRITALEARIAALEGASDAGSNERSN
jgi:methionyl-tRNA formyltransferase